MRATFNEPSPVNAFLAQQYKKFHCLNLLHDLIVLTVLQYDSAPT